MTLAELMQYLNANTRYGVLDGEPGQTLEKARSGKHRDALIGAIIAAIARECACADASATVERARVINALGSIRLKYMADDAPVEGFRTVEALIQAIDSAFNDEALRHKQRG